MCAAVAFYVGRAVASFAGWHVHIPIPIPTHTHMHMHMHMCVCACACAWTRVRAHTLALRDRGALRAACRWLEWLRSVTHQRIAHQSHMLSEGLGSRWKVSEAVGRSRKLSWHSQRNHATAITTMVQQLQQWLCARSTVHHCMHMHTTTTCTIKSSVLARRCITPITP